MTRATDDRANFACPNCDSSRIFRLTGTDGLYECFECCQKTHEKVEECRDDLEELASSDNPAGELAALLVGDCR